MALDIATSGMSRLWTRRAQLLGFLGFVAFAASLWVWRTGLQKDVLAELKATLPNVEYLMLCEYRGGRTSDSCQIIDGTTDFRLSTAIAHLSEASAPFFSGKGSMPSYKILRLGRGSSTSKQYLRCYSVIQFADWREIKMTPVL